MRPRTGTADRPGYVLAAVLLVIVILSLVAYRFTESMTAEYRASTRVADVTQARANAASGVYYAAAMLADPDTLQAQLGGNPYDNEALFRDVVARANPESPRQEGRFTLISVVPDGQGGYATRYGVTDETGKLNVNALIQFDPKGKVLSGALMLLPNMTEEVAAAIVDWVDPDEDPYNGTGAEAEYYGSLSTPYRAKNGPLNSIDELLLVRGVTPQLLYGNDRNRNGLSDDDPNGSPLDRGWADYLTVYGRYVNVDATGTRRINLKESEDLPGLYQKLQGVVGQEMAAYILAYKLWGGTTLPTNTRSQGGTTSGGSTGSSGSSGNPGASESSGGSGSSGSAGQGGGSTQGSSGRSSGGRGNTGNSSGGANQASARAASTEELVTAVEAVLAGVPTNKKQPSSVMALWNTQVTLPKPPARQGQPAPPTLTYPSPLNDPAKMAQYLPLLLDRVCVTGDVEMLPRININTAPREVLLAIPGMAEEDADKILNLRDAQSPTDPATTTGAWVVTAGGISPQVFQRVEKYVTGQTTVYRVHALGYFGQGGPTARVEAVIDTNRGAPRILFFRDLGDLDSPRGFEPPRR